MIRPMVGTMASTCTMAPTAIKVPMRSIVCILSLI